MLVETVGVGQSEVKVAAMVDLFLVLVAPGGGDELQGLKRGIMELADLVVVNKADGDLAAAAAHTAADYAAALHLVRPRIAGWDPRVLHLLGAAGRGHPRGLGHGRGVPRPGRRCTPRPAAPSRAVSGCGRRSPTRSSKPLPPTRPPVPWPGVSSSRSAQGTVTPTAAARAVVEALLGDRSA